MSRNFHVLSTKKLSADQLALLSERCLVTEQPLIKIRYKTVYCAKKIKRAVFTSQNAVKSVFEFSRNPVANFEKIYALQGRTAQLLEKIGIRVFNSAQDAKKLAGLILKKELHSQQIDFFCGNLRRNILPKMLLERGFKLVEHNAYRTELVPVKFDKKFDKVLFFSPSAIKSYVQAKNNLDAEALCIGNTTGAYAQRYFEKIIIAPENSVESVLSLIK